MIRFEEGNDLVVGDESQLPFKLLGNLGCGHSGTVEKVQDTVTGAVFARKKMVIRGKRSRAAIEGIFHNEVRIIRSFDSHHHIIRVFATYVAKREVGLILQPVADQGDLAQLLELIDEIRLEEKPDPRLQDLLQVVDRAFGCLANGLAFMHRKRVRHKDIKPQNILIHQGSVVYTDFGYSLDCSQFSHSTTDGQPDSLTRRYSAPEVRECGERNSSSDIFSLGCVFIELLAAKVDDSQFLPDEEGFAGELDNIHRYLDRSTAHGGPSLLNQTTMLMTRRDRHSRPKASQIAEDLNEHPELSCRQCRPNYSRRLVISTEMSRESKALSAQDRSSSASTTQPVSTDSSDHDHEANIRPAALIPEYDYERKEYLVYVWSEEYKKYYRKHYVDGQWKFLDWNTSKVALPPSQSPGRVANGDEQGHSLISTHKAISRYSFDFVMRSKDFYSIGRVVQLERFIMDYIDEDGYGTNRFVVAKQEKDAYVAVPLYSHSYNNHAIRTGLERFHGHRGVSFVLDATAFDVTHLSNIVIVDTLSIGTDSYDIKYGIHFARQFKIPYTSLVKDLGYVHEVSLPFFEVLVRLVKVVANYVRIILS